jgi:hypothetical protein
MNSAFAALWADFADFSDEQKDTMVEAGYYSILAREGVRIISFNTNYW